MLLRVFLDSVDVLRGFLVHVGFERLGLVEGLDLRAERIVAGALEGFFLLLLRVGLAGVKKLLAR